MAPLNIVNVFKSFGQAQVLHGVSASIDNGEFVALVGPSGCGKSTLLRMIAGLETVTAGDIFIDDKRINNLPPKSRDIAMVFQNYALYPHMTVAENMGFALRLAGTSATERDKRVRDAAEILGLVDLLARYPRQLSGGQRQRVAMGRAIVRSPKVFLFDEPLSNLDAKLRVQMRSEIKMLHNRLRTTTVFVTHDQIEAMTMADRIVVMHAGRIEQIGPPMELYDRPRNVFVASFIGSPGMNLLDVERQDDKAVASDGTIWVSGMAIDRGEEALTMGIRPEDVTIVAEQEGLGAEVLLVEPSGSEALVILQVGATRLSALMRERREFSPGDKVGITLDRARLHFFSRASGERLAK